MWDYILLGIIQGIFEWIPISSEGIVALTGQFLAENLNPIDVALFLHFGTIFAVLIYFRKDWKEVLTLKDRKLFRFLFLSTLISLLVGYPLYRAVRNIVVGNFLLVIMGFGLLITAYFQKKKRMFRIGFDKLAVISGFLQGLAVIPGLSRSGSTIFSLSLGKLNPSEALKVSYMMSVPTVLASSVYLYFKNPILVFKGWPALASSFLVGFFSLHFLINLAKKINFLQFTLTFGMLCLLGAMISSL